MAGVEDVAEAASDVDWKLKVGAQLLPHIMKWFGDSGNSKAQEEALRRMMQIATGQYNIQASKLIWTCLSDKTFSLPYVIESRKERQGLCRGLSELLTLTKG